MLTFTCKLDTYINILQHEESRLLRLMLVSCRVTLYVVPVVVSSVLLNVPKFFETEFDYEEKNG